MGCSSCGSGSNGTPGGCQNNGYCASGGCNRLNTFDWLSMEDVYDPMPLGIVEVSYKQGARKEFCHCPDYLGLITGDMVVVDEGNGYNLGRITLSGELVRVQMKKKRVDPENLLNKVVRRANDRDLQKLSDFRAKERDAMIQARVIARTLGVELKVGDVEYRGDGRKATFYYTADGRVDFRELVRSYAKEFRVKIEMRQIGARQESARIGGLGSCGRELCCSTWLTDFKSVNTSAARYQNLSINQTKLSGQCGRLKCCLNYELDTYMDALRHFPKNVDRIRTEKGTAVLIKTDIFKQLMYYAYETERGKSNITAVHVSRVKEIKAMHENGEVPADLLSEAALEAAEEKLLDFEDVTGVIELPAEKRRRRSRRGGRNRKSSGGQRRNKGKSQENKGTTKQDTKPGAKPEGKSGGSQGQGSGKSRGSRSNRRRGRGSGNKQGSGDKQTSGNKQSQNPNNKKS